MKIARGLTPAGDTVWARVTEQAEGPVFHRLDGAPRIEGNAIGGTVEIAQLLAPVEPPMLLCVGLNYADHAESLGKERPVHPVIVPKGINTVQAPGAPIELPRHRRSDKVDYEAELAVVLGRAARNVPRERALDFVLGYTCGNDVSARDWQFDFGGGQWAWGKAFDTFAPLGPWLVTRESLPNPGALEITCRVNGELRQQSSTAKLIFAVEDLIVFLSGNVTLPAGTVILTGTPSGVGMKDKPPRWLQAGDTVEVSIGGIGTLTNPVVEEAMAIKAI
jgi:2-keto-4-pentenoate hydratase/2-oxohepta-3-ene-1,7-dioic acid hydratase in catechol pathway